MKRLKHPSNSPCLVEKKKGLEASIRSHYVLFGLHGSCGDFCVRVVGILHTHTGKHGTQKEPPGNSGSSKAEDLVLRCYLSSKPILGIDLGGLRSVRFFHEIF